MRTQLVCDERTREVVRLFYGAPMPSILAKPFGSLMMHAGIDLLPDWASELLNEHQAAWRRPLIRASVQRVVYVLGWGLRNSAAQGAHRQLTLAA